MWRDYEIADPGGGGGGWEVGHPLWKIIWGTMKIKIYTFIVAYREIKVYTFIVDYGDI